jgi:hypothetical protein
LLRGDDAHAARFNRRLASILRNPIAPFSETLSVELKAPRPISDDSEGHVIRRVAASFLSAFRRLFIIEGWINFLAEHSDLGLTRATTQYVRMWRRKGIRISKSTLYRDHEAFARRGLLALVPHYRGGRPRRIPPADRALIEKLSPRVSFYKAYCAFRRDAGLPGRPISRPVAERFLKECLEHPAPRVHKRRSAHRWVAAYQEPRIRFEDAA